MMVDETGSEGARTSFVSHMLQAQYCSVTH